MRPMTARVILLALPLVLAIGAPATAEDENFCKVDNLTIGNGETRLGDLYFFARNTIVAGVHDGDLIGFSASASISGTVNGDVMLMGQTIDITGTVHDSVRVWGQTVSVTGTIDGDLLSFSATTNIHPDATIKGNVIIVGGTSIIDGTVEQGVKVTSGEVLLNGLVRGDVEVRADRISLGPGAAIEGDLIYTARKELEIENADAVKGEIVFKERVEDDEDEDDPFLTTSGFFWWAWSMIAALLVGFVLLALFESKVPSLVASIDDEPMLGTLIGFGSFLVVPAACLLAILLVISLPLGVMTLVIFAVTLYLAKLPVALWVGRRILSAVGRPAASPFLCLALGILLLYALFAIPFYLGFVFKLVVTWLGLGTIILAVRNGTSKSEPQMAITAK